MRRGVRRGCVRLKGALVGIDDEDDSTFTVTVDNKTFHFQAKDSEERERWIRALEVTISQHNTLARRILTRQGVMSMEDFDRKLGETDCYLQMLISQNSELELQVENEGCEDYKPLVEKVSEMVETVKHAIVLLQIAKNASCPEKKADSTEDIAGVHVTQKKVDTVEEAKENIDSDSRSSNMSTPITSPASVSPGPARVRVKNPASHKNSHTIPAVSYSSSDDDEDDFFDAHDDVASKASSDIGPDSSSSVQEEKTLVSPLTTNEVDHVDWDSLYEEAVEEEEVDMKNHGSVITHLLSQVRIGMDLTKIVLPTFILERRSLLEMYADFFAHPDIFTEISEKESPEQRIIQVLKWYLSAFSASRKTTVAKKPYNPILGEIFRCWYPTPSGAPTSSSSSPLPIAWCNETDLMFLAEQVSHHPPISAFYAECPAKNISFIGHIYTKSAFLGMSVAVHNIGDGKISVLSVGEDYVLTFPSAYGRSILTTPWVELGGSCKISCPQTGYNATIEFKTKPFFSNEQNKVIAEVFPPNIKKSILKVEGEWNGKMMAKYSSGKSELFLDMTNMPCVAKEVKRVSEQEKFESRRLWREVTHGLKTDNIEAATAGKQGLEQKQREVTHGLKTDNIEAATAGKQ